MFAEVMDQFYILVYNTVIKFSNQYINLISKFNTIPKWLLFNNKRL